ncbi:MAG: 2,4-dihydroxyhept-2-ene-1,7-dioic acid aldolase [Lewinellaceae bacterium]|nr:2,4-dihydroxyhept-2-ene-1,7-dioic acid aldolase [Lewinellaceae bacterium]
MFNTRLFRQWEAGKTATNSFLCIPHAWVTEVMSRQDWDSLTLDMQHGLLDYTSALAMLQAISTSDKTALVRLRWNDPSHIMQMLDAGAEGLICPSLETAAETAAFVKACRYPPEGIRSFGPMRAQLRSDQDYRETANRRVLTFAMIETREALRQVAEIAAVPGLDGLFIGPYDLSISLGLERLADIHYPPLREAIEAVRTVAQSHDLRTGIFTGKAAFVTELMDWGFDLVCFGTDQQFLQAGVVEGAATFRQKH